MALVLKPYQSNTPPIKNKSRQVTIFSFHSNRMALSRKGIAGLVSKEFWTTLNSKQFVFNKKRPIFDFEIVKQLKLTSVGCGLQFVSENS